MVTRSRVALGGAIAAAMATAALAPASAAALDISAISTTPSGTQAGSHPNLNLSLSFSGTSTPKALRIDLPPGFVGNPNAAARCPQATFAAGGCGPDSVVGSTVVHTIAGIGDATGGGGGGGGDGGGGGGLPLPPDVTDPICDLLPPLCSVLGISRVSALKTAHPDAELRRFTLGTRRLVGLPLDAAGTVYNLQPDPGEAARLGIAVRPLGGIAGEIRLQSRIEVRDGSDFGLTSSLDGLPAEFNGLATQITGMELTLHGHTSGGAAFVTLPTSCAPATTTVRVTPYRGSAATARASFTPTGCGAVPFTPTLQVAPSTTRVESNAAYAISLLVPGDEEPIRQAHVSETTVSLPLGSGLNPGTADGLEVCTDAQFARGERSAPTCPAASAVGTVSFTSPLVGTLTGTVYEGAPTPSRMLRLFVDVPGPGLRIKLVGDVTPDPRTGQVHSTFRGVPPLPFTAFELTFRGGDRSILTTPDRCGAAWSTASLVPNTGGAAATPQSMFMVDLDGAGTPCPDPLPFAPGIGVTVDPSTAGAFTAATTTVTRPERTQRLSDMKVSFPSGLVGGLGGGIGLCEVEKARAGDCPANSRVGSAQLVAGPGPRPLRIAGQVFLTAPFDGALAGLAIVVPGRVGPFDLGTTVSMAKIVVRPGDQGLDVTASGLPQVVGGIPLGLREIRLSLDRDGFMRNGTSCSDQQVTAAFTSALGATAAATAPYRATACNRVPFRPKLAGVAATRAQLAKGAHPTVTALVTQTPNEINARAVTVTLPREVGVDIENLNRTCPEGEDCGTRNVVGTATAVTPLLPIPLTGEVRLVTPAGGGLPQLKLDLKGLLNLTLTGKTALTPKGRVVNTFEGIPDVPLSRFALTIDGGDGGILVNNRRLRCGERLTGDAAFTGQSGAEHRGRGAFEVCGTISAAASRSATTRATARLRGRRVVVTVRAARRIRALHIELGRRMSISGRRAVSLTATKRARLAVARRSVAVRGLASRRVVVRLGPKGLTGERTGRRLTVKVRIGTRTATLRPRIR